VVYIHAPLWARSPKFAYQKHQYMRNLLTQMYATRTFTSSWTSVLVDLAVAVAVLLGKVRKMETKSRAQVKNDPEVPLHWFAVRFDQSGRGLMLCMCVKGGWRMSIVE
jgi:hypothetical protein